MGKAVYDGCATGTTQRVRGGDDAEGHIKVLGEFVIPHDLGLTTAPLERSEHVYPEQYVGIGRDIAPLLPGVTDGQGIVCPLHPHVGMSQSKGTIVGAACCAPELAFNEADCLGAPSIGTLDEEIEPCFAGCREKVAILISLVVIRTM